MLHYTLMTMLLVHVSNLVCLGEKPQLPRLLPPQLAQIELEWNRILVVYEKKLADLEAALEVAWKNHDLILMELKSANTLSVVLKTHLDYLEALSTEIKILSNEFSQIEPQSDALASRVREEIERATIPDLCLRDCDCSSQFCVSFYNFLHANHSALFERKEVIEQRSLLGLCLSISDSLSRSRF
jgi:hypothetical protein